MAGSTITAAAAYTALAPQQVANLQCVQANSAMSSAGRELSSCLHDAAEWDDDMSANCIALAQSITALLAST